MGQQSSEKNKQLGHEPQITEPPNRIWLARQEISGHGTWVQASGHDSNHVEYARVSVATMDETSLREYVLGFCPEKGRGNAILSVDGELTLLGKRLVRELTVRIALATGGKLPN